MDLTGIIFLHHQMLQLMAEVIMPTESSFPSTVHILLSAICEQQCSGAMKHMLCGSVDYQTIRQRPLIQQQ